METVQQLDFPSAIVKKTIQPLNYLLFIGEYLDILAVSCDSFIPETNALIGRQQGTRDHLQSLRRVREWCVTYKVKGTI